MPSVGHPRRFAVTLASVFTLRALSGGLVSLSIFAEANDLVQRGSERPSRKVDGVCRVERTEELAQDFTCFACL
jgi:hypothetical protein